jgi:hypothetical protein
LPIVEQCGTPNRSVTVAKSGQSCRWGKVATPEDLDETVKLVEKTGRRIMAEQGDVRDFMPQVQPPEPRVGRLSSGKARRRRLDALLRNRVGGEEHPCQHRCQEVIVS